MGSIGPGITWGIVGFGWVARDFALPALRAADQRVVGVCDPDPVARTAAARLDVPAWATLDELLAQPGLQAVYVATPNHLHRIAVEAAAAAGKAILCEKPMAAGLADAEAIAAAVRRAGVAYGTAFDQRHHPAHAAMRAALRSGSLGRVTAIRIVYACWLGPDWRAGGENWRAGGENWRADPRQAGGGALIDLAPHGLDLIAYLLDEPLAAVGAMTQRRVHDYAVDDGAMLLGRTASGVLASLHVAYNHPESLPRRRLEIVGEHGMLIAENTMGQDPGGSVLHLQAADGSARRLAVPDAGASPFTRQMAAFAAFVRGEAVVDGTGFDLARDLATMRLLSRAYESAACH